MVDVVGVREVVVAGRGDGSAAGGRGVGNEGGGVEVWGLLKMEVAAEKLLEMKVEAAVKARWAKLGMGYGGGLRDGDDDAGNGGGVVVMGGGLGVGRGGGDRLWVGGEMVG